MSQLGVSIRAYVAVFSFVSIPVLVNEPAGDRPGLRRVPPGLQVSIPVLVNEPAGVRDVRKERQPDREGLNSCSGE